MNDDDWVRLIRYLDDEATPSERAETERWIDADPKRRQALADVRRLRTASRAAAPEDGDALRVDREAIHQRIASAGDRRRAARPAVRSDRLSHRSRRRRALPLAFAAVAVLATGTWAVLSTHQIASEGDAATWATGPGQQVVVTLADGSRVRLAGQTTLSRPTRTERRYRLSGEARFEVARDPDRPFTVETAFGEARVLGTTFTVRTRSDEAATTVSVEEGRVAVRALEATGEVVLTAGQTASARVGQTPTRTDAAPEIAAADRLPEPEAAPVLRFDGATLAEVARALSEAHSVDIEVEGAQIAARVVSVDLTGVPLDQALDVLSDVLDLRAETRGVTVTLTPASPDVP